MRYCHLPCPILEGTAPLLAEMTPELQRVESETDQVNPATSVPSCTSSCCKERRAGRAIPADWPTEVDLWPEQAASDHITATRSLCADRQECDLIPPENRVRRTLWAVVGKGCCFSLLGSWAPFYWSYITNGSQGQVLGYLQSREWKVCCLIGNEVSLELRLLMILPGIQLGHIFWAWRHISGHLSFSWDFHMRHLGGLSKSPQSSCFRAAPAGAGKHLDGSIPPKARCLEQGSWQPWCSICTGHQHEPLWGPLTLQGSWEPKAELLAWLSWIQKSEI